MTDLTDWQPWTDEDRARGVAPVPNYVAVEWRNSLGFGSSSPVLAWLVDWSAPVEWRLPDAATAAMVADARRLAGLRQYVDMGIASYNDDPADTKYQLGYRAALEVMRAVLVEG